MTPQSPLKTCLKNKKNVCIKKIDEKGNSKTDLKIYWRQKTNKPVYPLFPWDEKTFETLKM